MCAVYDSYDGGQNFPSGIVKPKSAHRYTEFIPYFLYTTRKYVALAKRRMRRSRFTTQKLTRAGFVEFIFSLYTLRSYVIIGKREILSRTGRASIIETALPFNVIYAQLLYVLYSPALFRRIPQSKRDVEKHVFFNPIFRVTILPPAVN